MLFRSIWSASVAKVGLYDFGIGAHLRWRALGYDAPLRKHQNARAQAHDEIHVVLDDNEGRLLARVDFGEAFAEIREQRGIDAASFCIAARAAGNSDALLVWAQSTTPTLWSAACESDAEMYVGPPPWNSEIGRAHV